MSRVPSATVAAALARVEAGGAEAAVLDDAGVATAGDLRDLAAGIARGLRAAGAGPGARVALLLPRGRAETAALVACAAVGAVAVPLEPASPAPRNARILDGCGATLVVGSAGAAEALGRPVVEAVPAPGAPLAPGPSAPGDAFTLLHTSGSTGTPKGVPVTAAGVDAFIAWMVEEFGARPGDVVAAAAGLSFDLALFEQWGALAAGGVVARVPDRALLSPRALAAFLDGAGVAFVYAVPSLYLRLLAAAPPPALARARAFLFAGEPFPPASLRLLRERWPGRTLANLFGPTETNVCLFHRVPPGDPLDGPVPAGVPPPYAEVVLLREIDDAPEDAAPEDPAAEAGEIAVRGPTVLARYEGDGVPPLRLARVRGRGEAPFLRTGDLAERRDDGVLLFRGRRDDLLKVRGWRVEPGEVEAALARHPAVRDCVVRREEDPALGTVLAADVVPAPGAALDTAALRAHAASLLPPWMVPAVVRMVADLPRSARGKRRR